MCSLAFRSWAVQRSKENMSCSSWRPSYPRVPSWLSSWSQPCCSVATRSPITSAAWRGRGTSLKQSWARGSRRWVLQHKVLTTLVAAGREHSTQCSPLWLQVVNTAWGAHYGCCLTIVAAGSEYSMRCSPLLLLQAVSTAHSAHHCGCRWWIQHGMLTIVVASGSEYSLGC